MQLKCCLTNLKLLAVIVLIFPLINGGNVLPKQKCQNKDCERLAKIAADIVNSGKWGLNPCDDYYEYACGNWINLHPKPPLKSDWDVIDIMKQKVQLRLKKLIEAPITHGDSKAIANSKQLFKACMNTDGMERAGIDRLIHIVNEKDGLPMSMTELEYRSAKLSWEEIHLRYMILTGDGALFKIIVAKDPNQTEKRIFIAKPTGIYGKYRDLINLNNRETYMQFVKEVANNFARARNSTISEIEINRNIESVMAFRSQLKSILATKGKTSKSTIDQLNAWNQDVDSTSPAVDWLRHLKRLFVSIPEISITGKTKIIVTDKDYLMKLLKLLKSKPKRTIINHLHLYFVENHLIYTTAKMRKWMSTLNKKLGDGKPLEQGERWEKCLSENYMRHGVSSMYVKKYFPLSSKQAVQQIFGGLRKAMEEQIKKSWLDETNKMRALQKLQYMKADLGYPDWYEDDNAILAFYDGMAVGEDYLQNALSFEQNEFRMHLMQLTARKVRPDFRYYPVESDARYAYNGNAVEIAAGYFLWPHFSPGLPVPINYGTVATVIGHEMSHGFDDDGITYDYRGHSSLIWTAAATREHSKRVKCIKDKYKSYSILELHNPTAKANSEQTASEDFADILAMQIAYDSYKVKMQQNPVQPKLPGLENKTNDEIFFLSYAMTYCGTITSHKADILLNMDTHSMPRLRVNGPLSNLPEFARTYNCKQNTPMNPVKKCSLWARTAH